MITKKIERRKEIKSFFNKLNTTAKKTSNKDNAVIVDGLDDVMVRMGNAVTQFLETLSLGLLLEVEGLQSILNSVLGGRSRSDKTNQC